MAKKGHHGRFEGTSRAARRANGLAGRPLAPPSLQRPGSVENTVSPHPAKEFLPENSATESLAEKNLAAESEKIGPFDSVASAIKEAFAPYKVEGNYPDEFRTLAAEFVRCGPWIGDALKHAGGLYGLQDAFRGVLSRDYELWPGKRSAAVTEVAIYPRRKTLNVLFAGDAAEWPEMLPDLERHAAARGCSAVRLLNAVHEGYTASLTATKELAHD